MAARCGQRPIVQGSPRIRKFAFYQIIWQLIVSDFLAQFIQLLVAVPIYGEAWPFYAVSALETIGYNGVLYFNFLLGINRFLVFYAPSLDKAIFDRSRIRIIISFIWVYVLCFVAVLNLTGCNKDFSAEGFYFFHNCTQVSSSWIDFCRKYLDWTSHHLPLLIVILHALTILKVKIDVGRAEKQRRQSGYNLNDIPYRHVERRFAIQSILINTTLVLEYVAFNVAPHLPPMGQWSYVVSIAINLVCIFNNMISPIVIFAFNSDIRKTFVQFLPVLKNK